MASNYLLIYDSHCPYCTATARLAELLSSKIETSAYRSDKAQEILKESFDEPGFTLYLFSDEKIFYGNEAAKKTADIIGMPNFMARFFSTVYPFLVKIFSILSFRTRKMKMPKDYSCRSCKLDEESGGMVVGSERKEKEKKERPRWPD